MKNGMVYLDHMFDYHHICDSNWYYNTNIEIMDVEQVKAIKRKLT